MPESDNLIELNNLSKVYRTGDIETTALSGVTIEIRNGEFIAIMGPSGCGKSTLLNLLGMLDTPTSGQLLFRGVDIAGYSEAKLGDLRKANVGFVFQSFNLLKRTTALRQVELPLIYGGGSKRSERANKALEAVGLERRVDHLPSDRRSAS